LQLRPPLRLPASRFSCGPSRGGDSVSTSSSGSGAPPAQRSPPMPSSLLPPAMEDLRRGEPPRIGADEAPLAPAVAGGIVRPLAPQDVGAVAALFQKLFRRTGKAAPA